MSAGDAKQREKHEIVAAMPQVRSTQAARERYVVVRYESNACKVFEVKGAAAL